MGDGTALARESVEITVENQITIQGTPVKFGDAGTVGWYTIEGKDEWTMITFVDKTATVPNLKTGTKVCVEYNAVDDGIKQFTVPAAIIPSEVPMYMTSALFAGGELSQDQKDAFFEAVMKAYITCKEEARVKFGRKNVE